MDIAPATPIGARTITGLEAVIGADCAGVRSSLNNDGDEAAIMRTRRPLNQYRSTTNFYKYHELYAKGRRGRNWGHYWETLVTR